MVDNAEISFRMHRDINAVISRLKKSAPDMIAAFLVGGFGRGEGGVLINERTAQPINDYDFVVFCRGKAEQATIDKLRGKLAIECKIRQVDIDIRKASEVSRLKFTMSNFDLVNCSYQVFGPENFLSRAPKMEASKMPKKEGVVPLFLYLSSLLNAHQWMKSSTIEQQFWAAQQISKSVIGWVTAKQVFDGSYHPSYVQRQGNYISKFNPSNEVEKLVSWAFQIKLKPDLDLIREVDLQKHFYYALECHLFEMQELLKKYFRCEGLGAEELVKRYRFSMSSNIRRIYGVISGNQFPVNRIDINAGKFLACLYLNENENTKRENYRWQLHKILRGSRKKARSSNSANFSKLLETLRSEDVDSRAFANRGDRIFYE